MSSAPCCGAASGRRGARGAPVPGGNSAQRLSASARAPACSPACAATRARAGKSCSRLARLSACCGREARQ